MTKRHLHATHRRWTSAALGLEHLGVLSRLRHGPLIVWQEVRQVAVVLSPKAPGYAKSAFEPELQMLYSG